MAALRTPSRKERIFLASPDTRRATDPSQKFTVYLCMYLFPDEASLLMFMYHLRFAMKGRRSEVGA